MVEPNFKTPSLSLSISLSLQLVNRQRYLPRPTLQSPQSSLPHDLSLSLLQHNPESPFFFHVPSSLSSSNRKKVDLWNCWCVCLSCPKIVWEYEMMKGNLNKSISSNFLRELLGIKYPRRVQLKVHKENEKMLGIRRILG